MGRERREESWHEDARQAVRVLKQGGVLLHATDTVWGLACDATNNEAVRRMNTIKARHPIHPVLVLVADEGHVEQLVGDVPEAAWDLMELETVPPPWSTPKARACPQPCLAPTGVLRCDAFVKTTVRM